MNNKPWQSCFRPGLLHKKVAIVSGGGTGIGYAITKELVSLGCTVIITSRDVSKCHKAVDEINTFFHEPLLQQKQQSLVIVGKAVVGPPTNIRKEEDVQSLISHVVKEYGSVNILVNNAGGQFVCAAEDLSSKGFAAVVETNLLGTFQMCREVYTQYMKDHGGCIVNITLGNRNGMPCMVHSGAARAGIENMTATLCSEWMESNVRINCVRPGIIWTESGFANYGPMGDAFIDKVLPSLPAKRFGSPEEVSSAVVWLCTEGAGYVTGSVVSVDGGSAFHFLPLIDIEDSVHLDVYGSLPRKAML